MTEIRLSKRMKTVADMVTPSVDNTVCDIGCDHAFVSIYLKKKGIASRVIAMDVKEGPLNIARANIDSFGLKDYIEVRASDGFEALMPNEADVAIIAGMGGSLIVDILKRGKIHTDAGIELIIQPQSDIPKVRKYLYDIGYTIEDENFLIDEGKYYTVIKAVNNSLDKKENVESPYELSEAELNYGPVLLKKKTLVLKEYLELILTKNKELMDKLNANPTDKGSVRVKELIHANELINQVLSRY